MFSKACAIAGQFTFPIIISTRTYDKKCSVGIGACVIINKEGWFVTAYHIIAQLKKLIEANQTYTNLVAQRAAIENDQNIKSGEKQRRLGTLRIPSNSIINCSVIVRSDLNIANDFHVIPEADIAVGRFINFDPDSIKEYPKFKNPNEPMNQGTSLCKMGFPFHGINPTFDEERGCFMLPPEALPAPIFPIEGIFTRTIHINPNIPSKHPLMYIETSSPGLRGQSGGPTFDINGAIWAIQSNTQHLKLGFGEGQKGSKESEHLQNQYLNVGWGTHVKTLTSLLTEKNINFEYYK